MHCAQLKDRFAIFDAGQDNLAQVSEFRNHLGVDHLKYGAAYFPSLNTTLGYHYSEDSVQIIGEARQKIGVYSSSDNGLSVTYTGQLSQAPKIKILKKPNTNASPDAEANTSPEAKTTAPEISIDNNVVMTITMPTAGATAKEIEAVWKTFSSDKKAFEITVKGTGEDAVTEITSPQALTHATLSSSTVTPLRALKSDKTALYNEIKAKIDNQRLTLPPVRP
ncbi:MAG: hypothetical protein HamCj_00520 [Candidatus Hamiltonella defensa (Ceratovacuna japonica)]